MAGKQFKPAGAGTRVFDMDDDIPKISASQINSPMAQSFDASSSSVSSRPQSQIPQFSRQPLPPPNPPFSSRLDRTESKSFTEMHSFMKNQNTDSHSGTFSFTSQSFNANDFKVDYKMPEAKSSPREQKVEDEEDPLLSARATIGKVQGILAKINSSPESSPNLSQTSELMRRIERLKNFDPINGSTDELLKETNRERQLLEAEQKQESPKNASNEESEYSADDSDAEGYEYEPQADRIQSARADLYFSIDLPATEDLYNIPSVTRKSKKSHRKQKRRHPKKSSEDDENTSACQVSFIDSRRMSQASAFVPSRYSLYVSPVVSKLRGLFPGKLGLRSRNQNKDTVYYYKGNYLDEDFLESSGEVGKRLRAKYMGIPYHSSQSMGLKNLVNWFQRKKGRDDEAIRKYERSVRFER